MQPCSRNFIMFTYQHRTKQSLDHISTCFSLSRDHNKLCIGQCSRLSEFGVVKVRPRACLLSIQERPVPGTAPSQQGVTASAAWRGRHLLLLSQNSKKTSQTYFCHCHAIFPFRVADAGRLKYY